MPILGGIHMADEFKFDLQRFADGGTELKG